MLRDQSLEEISDGKLYKLSDMARVDSKGCLGCSEVCCKNMADTIVLTPIDVHRLSRDLPISPDQLLERACQIGQVDGLLLPHMKMSKSNNACIFLDAENRCLVHNQRPDVCRLFPLGRLWSDDGDFSYILQKNQCKKHDLVKIRVRDWIGNQGPEYDAYIKQWHRLLKIATKKNEDLIEAGQETKIKVLCKYILKKLYLTPYVGADGETLAEDMDFYTEFKKRIEEIEGRL